MTKSNVISVLFKEKIHKLRGSYVLKTASDFPAIVYLQTLNRCNYSCPMCPYDKTTKKEPMVKISMGLFEKIISELSREKDFINLTLDLHNEPLLDKNLLNYAKKFKKEMPTKILEIETNGSLLTKENIPLLYKYFDNIYISLSASESKTYKEVTNTKNFRKIYSTLKYISTSKIWMDKTIIRFINQKVNTNEKREFKKYWNKIGFKVLSYDMNNRANNVSDFEKKSPPRNRFKKRMLKFVSKKLLNKCPIPFRLLSICSNGDVPLCFNDWSKNNIMGNVNQSTIREIFNSKQYKKVREETKNHTIKNNLCEHCNLYNDGIWMT